MLAPHVLYQSCQNIVYVNMVILGNKNGNSCLNGLEVFLEKVSIRKCLKRDTPRLFICGSLMLDS